MDTQDFIKIFNNYLSKKQIFKHVKSIHAKLGVPSHKWSSVINNGHILIKYNYFNEFKQLYNRINNDKNIMENLFSVLSTAISYARFEYAEFIFDKFIEDNERYQNYLQSNKFLGLGPLIYNAAVSGKIESLLFLESKTNYLKFTPLDYYRALHITPVKGNLEMVKWIVNKLPTSPTELQNKPFCSPLLTAATSGKIDIIEWIIESTKSKSISFIDSTPIQNLAQIALENGHTAVAEWIHKNHSDQFGVVNFDELASKCSIDSLKWCQLNCSPDQIQCTTSAMDNASGVYGRLDVIQWLHENRSEGCTTKAIDWAAANGHFHIVRWLSENRTEGCSDNAIKNAALEGHFEMFKYLEANHPTTAIPPRSLFRKLIEDGEYPEIIKYIFRNYKDKQGQTRLSIVNIERSTIDKSINNIEVLKFLHEEGPTAGITIKCSRDAVLECCSENEMTGFNEEKIKVLDYIITHDICDDPWSLEILFVIINTKHLEIAHKYMKQIPDNFNLIEEFIQIIEEYCEDPDLLELIIQFLGQYNYNLLEYITEIYN